MATAEEQVRRGDRPDPAGRGDRRDPAAVATGRRTRSHLSSQALSQTRPFSSGHAARRDNDERLRKHRAAAETHVLRRVSCKTEYSIHARVRPATSGQQETSGSCTQDARLSAERPTWPRLKCQPCTRESVLESLSFFSLSMLIVRMIIDPNIAQTDCRHQVFYYQFTDFNLQKTK